VTRQRTRENSAVSLAVDLLRSGSRGRWQLVEPCEESFWRGHADLVAEVARSEPEHPQLRSLQEQEVVLGFLGASHLGDVLCTTPLARLLKEQRACKVFVIRHRSTYNVFANNPHIEGFKNDPAVPLSPVASGSGQIIQRLTAAFGFGVDPFPKGEIYLSDAELQWAWSVRATLPRNRPVALVAPGSITDEQKLSTGQLHWQEWVDALAKEFTVVQAPVTKVETLEEVIRLTDQQRRLWLPDSILNNIYVLENLPLRHFIAMFAVIDLFLGRNSGGAHVAAAMGVPGIVALSRRKYSDVLDFPDRGPGRPWRHQSFLYPHHTFLLQQ
jgi:ADP-heptose:LPS heptosyltransferase